MYFRNDGFLLALAIPILMNTVFITLLTVMSNWKANICCAIAVSFQYIKGLNYELCIYLRLLSLWSWILLFFVKLTPARKEAVRSLQVTSVQLIFIALGGLNEVTKVKKPSWPVDIITYEAQEALWIMSRAITVLPKNGNSVLNLELMRPLSCFP